MDFVVFDMFIFVNMSNGVYHCCFVTKCMSGKNTQMPIIHWKIYTFSISGLSFFLSETFGQSYNVKNGQIYLTFGILYGWRYFNLEDSDTVV